MDFRVCLWDEILETRPSQKDAPGSIKPSGFSGQSQTTTRTGRITVKMIYEDVINVNIPDSGQWSINSLCTEANRPQQIWNRG